MSGAGRSVLTTESWVFRANEVRVGFHATSKEIAPLIMNKGFLMGSKPGRLGSKGVYVNNTISGAIAEARHSNPLLQPSVLRVEYIQGRNAAAAIPPRNYVMQHPLNVDTISAPSVRAPGTINTNILNGSARPMGIIK